MKKILLLTTFLLLAIFSFATNRIDDRFNDLNSNQKMVILENNNNQENEPPLLIRIIIRTNDKGELQLGFSLSDDGNPDCVTVEVTFGDVNLGSLRAGICD